MGTGMTGELGRAWVGAWVVRGIGAWVVHGRCMAVVHVLVMLVAAVWGWDNCLYTHIKSHAIVP